MIWVHTRDFYIVNVTTQALSTLASISLARTHLSSHTHPRRGDFVIYKFYHIRRLDVNAGGVFFIHVKSYMLHWNFCCVFEYLNVMCVWCRNGKLIWAVVEMEEENFKKLKKIFTSLTLCNVINLWNVINKRRRVLSRYHFSTNDTKNLYQ
jgi:hypothetical protein